MASGWQILRAKNGSGARYGRICKPAMGRVDEQGTAATRPAKHHKQAITSGCNGTWSVMNMDTRQLPCARAKVRGAQGPSSHNDECNTDCLSRFSCCGERSMIFCSR